MSRYQATALAHSNIALVKYWGKRDTILNLPAVGSISFTLKALETRTSVSFSDTLSDDSFLLNGEDASEAQCIRLSRFVNIFRHRFNIDHRISVISENNFPTSAGLASSASGFAALTSAINAALSLDLSDKELSIFARQGSGSAARSIFGGIVEMYPGTANDGQDAYAEQLFGENYWDLRLVIAVTSEAEKPVGSTDGMNLTADTSPYYSEWVQSSEHDLRRMRNALDERNFQHLGQIAEQSCLKMHGLAMSANPGILYWNATTVRLIHKIRELRRDGLPVYFTIDAGPQVKVICQPEHLNSLAHELETIDGVKSLIISELGPGARIIEED